MPEIIDIINKLKTFALFEGLGTRELHAVATITREQTLSLRILSSGQAKKIIPFTWSCQVK